MKSLDYQNAVDYLYGYVNFEHKRLNQYAPENITLERPAELLDLLGNPHRTFRSIHIAGTKGKGSVAAMCASSLRAAGLKAGLYTSPHLQDFRDRIRILRPSDGDGRISQANVVQLVETLKPAAAQVPGVTWYELVTAIAFLHFADQRVDVAVVEVGLGGRLDATNLLNPMVSLITSLSLDHTYLLGHTLAEIAAEKGGIIKPGIPAITAPQEPEAMERLVEIAAARAAPLTVIGREWDFQPHRSKLTAEQPVERWKQQLTVTKSPAGAIVPQGSIFTLALDGRHQLVNAAVALAALDTVKDQVPELSLAAITTGMANVNWPGRLQILTHGGGRPTVLVDCAHNVDSAEKLAYALKNDYLYDRLWLIIGATTDKDVTGILRALMPLTGRVILTASTHPRATTPAELIQLATNLGYEAQASAGVAEAFKKTWQAAGAADLICLTGSIFVVADLLNQWDALQSHLSLLKGRILTEE
jgi:dihydrofolate synthase/folylpolyglutamate synthase